MLGKAIGGEGGAEDRILIQHQEVSGTDAGGLTSGAWQTRPLTDIVYDDGGHASLDGNRITLAAGTYRVEGYAVAYRPKRHKVRLYNISDSSDLIIGLTAYSDSVEAVATNSPLDGKIILAEPKLIELQHRCEVTKTVNGMGLASSLGVIEVYASIKFSKEA